ncbi:MAG: M48 family metallopeptidase [Burkholderiaceae bacterium]|nr:M48 family metallopeptidase [Burkholderiaceae bacterium]
MPLKHLFRKKAPDPNQLTLDDLFSTAADAAPPASTVPDTPVPPGHRRLRLDHLSLDYRLLRSKRKTIGFLIDDDGLRVTAPRWVTVADIEAAIAGKQQWIFRKMNEQRERSVRRLQPPMEWRDGATLPYLGIEITVRVAEGSNAGVRFDEAARELHISLPASASEQQLKDRVQGWLQSEAKRVFAERLAIYAEKLGVSFARFALSSATTQWGSCTADGRIRLNWRLMHFALPNIDYVVAHELSHLREMNHGPQFWATVQSVLPEFESARKALRDHEPESLPKF